MAPSGGKKPTTREDRIKAALRENLKRRKQRARAVAASRTPEEPVEEDKPEGAEETISHRPT